MVDNGVGLLTTTSKLAAHTNKIQTPLAKAAIDECIWSECYFVVFVVPGRKDAKRTPMS